MADDERLHDQLWQACKTLPGDYKPWGKVDRDDLSLPGQGADCSCGCIHYLVLKDVGEQQISFDWGVCLNPKSHRYGLLTFEHQGCPAFEYDSEEGDKFEAELERWQQEYLKAKAEGRLPTLTTEQLRELVAKGETILRTIEHRAEAQRGPRTKGKE